MTDSLDKKDQAILAVLKQDGRLSWKEVGEKVYLSGQAVGNHIQNLIDNQIINHFTVALNYPHLQFITVYMDNNQFSAFEKLILTYNNVLEFYKIAGDGCYFIKSSFSLEQLDAFLVSIAPYCRYKVSQQLRKIEK